MSASARSVCPRMTSPRLESSRLAPGRSPEALFAARAPTHARLRLPVGMLVPALLLLSLPARVQAHPDPVAHAPAQGAGAVPSSDTPASGTEKASPGSDKASGKDDKPAWDVNHPPGPTRDIPIDTREGTWMSLDVSPDGKEVLFDLLGDLYTLPIAGGEATSLTSGMAWDMQPRYSPDGRFIAFTSDRDGGDNLWIMNRDGSNPTQVTHEDFRLVNSPAWSPDSQYLIGRKHFTAQRSLGAGEIWLYHRTGGSGLQLTKKQNEQKDVGEPAFSADGRFVYFSQDVTPGPNFEYNKDPNKGIYAIQRLERDTGELTTFLGGTGGAIRPTPSPDGKTLAYIRRIQGKSVLILHDLTSGVDTRLYDGLDRDMQETWAIHGVYPTLAWTPDNRSLVVWAKGKLWRIDVGSKQVSPIPFHVKTTRTITEALRFPQEVAPAKQQTKLLRYVQVSPDGKQVVYQALGYLYVRDLPDGPPRRLTQQKDHFELYPSWTRDSSAIVYATWNDQTLGSIRVVSARGGEGAILTTQPGEYLEPQLSPDVRTLVYRRAAGGYLLSNTWSHDPGIYVQPLTGTAAKAGSSAPSKAPSKSAANTQPVAQPVALPVAQAFNPLSLKPDGAPRLLTRNGGQAHFGADPLRLYFLRGTEDDRIQLRRIELDGSDERPLFTSAKATELRISPDDQWVAWRESFNAYIAPLFLTGQAVELSPEMKALPCRKVSQDSGEYLHWSGQSQKLYWTLGPELFEKDVKDTFPYLTASSLPAPEKPADKTGDKAAEKPADAPVKGRFIGLEYTLDVPTTAFAFTHARLITMKGNEVIEDGTLVVRGNRIEALGPFASVTIPADAQRIDATGKTLLPGLVDVHFHGGQATNEIIPQQNWILYAALAFGVTTAHDPSNDTEEIFSAAEMQRAGLIIGPRIFSTGTILYGADAPFKAEINSYEDALSHLTRQKAMGAFSVKSYNQPRRNQRQQVLAAARALNMMVVPEGGSTFMHNLTMVVDGHTGVEHAIPVAAAYADVLQLWGQTKVGYTPTLGVGYGGIMGEEYWYRTDDVYAHPRLTRFVPREILDARARRRELAPLEEYNHIQIAKTAKALLDAGVNIQLGAHGQREGLAAHWELWMFVQGGMSPMEALRTGTLGGARYLGLDHDLGSLEPGKLADLMVLEKNPLEDIHHSETIQYTMVNGRLFDAWTLDEVGGRAQKRQRWWFQDQ